jgi:NTE family protein
MGPNVAIACQGGGSHTAFTAGVLEEALPWIEGSDARLVGLSGTSGGALSAVAGWYGYVDRDAAAAADIIQDLWADVAVSTPIERVVNDWTVWGLAARNSGYPVPQVSPYAVPWTEVGEARFRSLVTRHVDFERVSELAGPNAPKLIVGTVDVEAGTFETFENGDVSADAVMASAAVPNVFEAVELHGTGHWDGLFSQNPPITELLKTDYDRKADELWIVQINPQTTDGVPKSLQSITDRRRELSANIGLNQQVSFVEAINGWVREGLLPEDRFKDVTIRKLILDREFSLSTKLKRTESFLEEVQAEGREVARETIDIVEATRSQ